MIFGSINQFAIEANPLEHYGKFYYGNFRIWISGLAIGNFEDSMDLATSARWTKTFLNRSAYRCWAGIDDSLPGEIFERLYLSQMKRDYRKKEDCQFGVWDWFAFTLDGVGDSSTEGLYGILSVRGEDGCDRVIAMDLETQHICYAKLLAGSLDEVLGEYLKWVVGLFPSVLDNIRHE